MNESQNSLQSLGIESVTQSFTKYNTQDRVFFAFEILILSGLEYLNVLRICKQMGTLSMYPWDIPNYSTSKWVRYNEIGLA